MLISIGQTISNDYQAMNCITLVMTRRLHLFLWSPENSPTGQLESQRASISYHSHMSQWEMVITNCEQAYINNGEVNPHTLFRAWA